MTKQKPRILINPPPRDARCECCGRHASELKPFGGAGDPLVGDFKGALLVKTFRRMAPPGIHSYEIDDLLDEEGQLDEKKFIEKYSKEDLESFYFAEQLMGTVEASWECRDCIILDGEDFYNKRDEYRKKLEKEKE